MQQLLANVLMLIEMTLNKQFCILYFVSHSPTRLRTNEVRMNIFLVTLSHTSLQKLNGVIYFPLISALDVHNLCHF